ncbi:Glutamine-dependent NAD(+) synthetase [Teratosphaeria destructans]|uniref:Glutamine-dependent NAD(+) synthetase n=1 Tax=Teratosphaeria destructans TaxID=418781 RepID=A0A9W7SZV5_9PEZI|nr:Glutamine-dependent NAD(+) synthetase [Teratosphaeria destructans]
MTRKCVLATSQLNQWALDWDGNRDRIIEAIKRAKHEQATLILTPELCIPGYGLLDHWLENDVYANSWDIATEIISNGDCQDIIIDLGLPIQHRGCSYNARLIALNGEVLAIRPKLDLCNDGNFREMRYFTPWPRGRVEEYALPEVIQRLDKKQKRTRIGEVAFETLDASFASETCEELWTPMSPHSLYSLAGIEIVLNSSGSHHELRKLDTRINLIQEATAKTGGVYMYSNQRGCDGDRLYYDGCSLIMNSGKLLAQGSQFSLQDVEVQTALVDLDGIWAMRTSRSRGMQAQDPAVHRLERIHVDFSLCRTKKALDPRARLAEAFPARYHEPEEEIALGPACWLWDYLRRSGAKGFLVPLSGGIDSCATATIVYSMCRLVIAAIKSGNEVTIADVKRLSSLGNVSNLTAEQLCNSIFTTVFMGMEKQSSKDTRRRAKELAAAIGAHHIDTNIDPMFQSLKGLVSGIIGFEPKFKVESGSETENLALQNFQARSRMVLAYALAQLVPKSRSPTSETSGSYLVLGSANVDECLRGYLTKYDCSSADINPIGGISKTDLKRFIKWSETHLSLPILQEFLDAVPTAELEPIVEADTTTGKAAYVQSDEADMGFTYDELSIFGRLRKQFKLGPVGAFERLVVDWSDHMDPRAVMKKVLNFYRFYRINRHKMTTMTPGLYLESYTPDDNRFDLRPFLYPSVWGNYEKRKIENILRKMEEGEAGINGA